MINRAQIAALSDEQLVEALVTAAQIISAAEGKPKNHTPAFRIARQREAQAAKAAVEEIKAEITLREYKATVGGPLLTERKPGWCWGDERPSINRSQKKGGGVWLPVMW